MSALAAIEAELVRNAQSEKRRWQEVAGLLMRVERERLWPETAPSFTAWLQGVARRADLQESVFWRCLKAGRIYLELSGREALDQDLDVSAESLELADKISRHAPKAVVQQVLARTLDGELGRSELRQVWQTYKPAAGGTTARGRLPVDAQEREEALAARQAEWRAQQRKPENRAEVRRSELAAAFRSASWLGSFDQAHGEAHTEKLVADVCSLLVVRRDAHQPAALELHGLWTCVSTPELADFNFGPAPGVELMWLAVPTELTEGALQKAPRLLGLLEQQRDRSLVIRRPAKRRQIDAQARVDLFAALLGRAYVWP